jgi:hypothetical protein
LNEVAEATSQRSQKLLDSSEELLRLVLFRKVAIDPWPLKI